MAYVKNPYKFAVSNSLDAFPERWVAIDTETGGLDPTRNALLSVAVCGPDCEPVQFFIRDSDGTNEASALEVNGINVEELAEKGISKDEAREKFVAIVRGRAIVGQNLPFDLGFIASRLFGLGPEEAATRLFDAFQLFDTKAIFRKRHKKNEQPGASLGEIATFYGVEFDEALRHDALFDARLTAAVFLKEYDEWSTLKLKP